MSWTIEVTKNDLHNNGEQRHADCYEAHRDQKDKGGTPYIFHPAHLAEQFDDEIQIVVALLHDVVEDTDWTIDGLEATGFFSQKVLDAIEVITRREAEPYTDYIARVKQNEIARAVKKADLIHNLTQERCWCALPNSLVERYKSALMELDKESRFAREGMSFDYPHLIETVENKN